MLYLYNTNTRVGPNLRDFEFNAISDHQTDLTIVSIKINAMGVKGIFGRSIIFGHKVQTIKRDVLYHKTFEHSGLLVDST